MDDGREVRLSGDADSPRAIMAASSAQDCKRLGRAVTPYDDGRRSAAWFNLVTRGNVAKFGQNAALKDYFLATGDDILVEAAPRDAIGGIGPGRDNPGASNPLAWRGLNLLGFALVRARAISPVRAEIGGFQRKPIS